MLHRDLPAPNMPILDMCFSAIEAHGWIPKQAPILPDLPAYMSRDNIENLVIEATDGGYVVDIYFDNVPAGMPDTVGTPEALPLPYDMALLCAGALLTQLITGELREPFFIAGNKLVCAAYKAHTSPWTPPWRR